MKILKWICFFGNIKNIIKRHVFFILIISLFFIPNNKQTLLKWCYKLTILCLISHLLKIMFLIKKLEKWNLHDEEIKFMIGEWRYYQSLNLIYFYIFLVIINI
jgi:hypothetical protein